MSLNPKLYGFFKVSCCLCSKAPLACFPTVWNVGETTSKICRQQCISVPTTKKKRSVTRFRDFDCYSMGYTPGKLLTLTKSTRQQHHKSKGGNPCSHFRISWDYDTAVIKDRMTPVVKGDRVINTAQETKRAPYS